MKTINQTFPWQRIKNMFKSTQKKILILTDGKAVKHQRHYSSKCHL